MVRDLAVMLANGGDCLADVGGLRDQAAQSGPVASDSTAFRVIDRIARDPGALDRLRAAHAQARERVWEFAGAPERLTIDLDATLIGSHSDKEGAAGNHKGGFGFHPMLAYADETGEALAGELRPGNAGSNTAADQITVAEQALEQIPAEHVEAIKLLLRVDFAGAVHGLLDWAREAKARFSVGSDLTEPVRAAIEQITDADWVCALDQDGGERPNGHVEEITDSLDLEGWPDGSRVIVRRERAHPGAQLTFTDDDGHRFQAILTDQHGDPAVLERDHRGRARVEDHIRNDKDTGMRNMPFRDFEHNRVWLELVRIAHDLLAWTQRLLLTGELARTEPKRLRYRLLHSPSTPAAPDWASSATGPGPVNSPPRSSASKRSPHQPDTTRTPLEDQHDPRHPQRPAPPGRYQPRRPPKATADHVSETHDGKLAALQAQAHQNHSDAS